MKPTRVSCHVQSNDELAKFAQKVKTVDCIVVNSADEARALCNALNAVGYKWFDGKSLTEDIRYQHDVPRYRLFRGLWYYLPDHERKTVSVSDDVCEYAIQNQVDFRAIRPAVC